MAFTLQPLTRTDVPHCITIYFAAFQNAHSLGCWPRTPNIRTWWENMIYDELDEPGAQSLKAVTGSGEMAGFVKSVQPKHGIEPDTALPQWLTEADHKLCDETFGKWARRRRELMDAWGHWCTFFSFPMGDETCELTVSRSGDGGHKPDFPGSGSRLSSCTKDMASVKLRTRIPGLKMIG